MLKGLNFNFYRKLLMIKLSTPIKFHQHWYNIIRPEKKEKQPPSLPTPARSFDRAEVTGSGAPMRVKSTSDQWD